MNSATQKERLHECFGTVDFTVYADFNCPFCYALHERLFALGLEHQVDFRLIQHLPEIQGGKIDLEMLSALTAEVAEVRRRAPSTEINLPMFRPNTAAPTALSYAMSRKDPVQAVQLRRRIYRAFWVDGQDISDADTLARLLLDLELEIASPIAMTNQELAAWQSEWSNNTAFDRHLPVIISENGETVVGPLFESELNAFLESGSLVSERTPGELWEPPKRQRILVLENHAPSLRIIVEQMHDAQVEVADDFIGLIAHARNLGSPDLLLVNTRLIGEVSGSDWWRNSTNSDPDPEIPIIHILEDTSAEKESAAFAAGATDVIARPFHPKLLRSRLNSHLQTRRLRQQFNKASRLDTLTSICNRREFNTRLSAEWGRSARAGDSVALLLIDVDRLRAYNDSFGHLQGDECLVSVAQLLSSCLQRSGDLIARRGGGSFVVLLPAVEIDNALKVARDCRQTVANAKIPHPASSVAPHVTVSIGVSAMEPVYDESCTLLIEQAEIALYQAKRQGQDSICAFTDAGGGDAAG